MSSLYNFIRRHRRKLLWGGAAVGGLLLATRVLERQMARSRELEHNQALERTRKRNHYETTECTCNSTLSHLYMELKARIVSTYNTASLTDALRNGPSGEEKIRIWQEIKMLTFCKTAAFVIGEAFLGVLVRVQLNILAGYLFTERVAVMSPINNNRDGTRTKYSTKLQEAYLNIAEYFINQGFDDLCEVLLFNVQNIVDAIPLQEMLNLQDMENIFQRILEAIYTEMPDRNLFFNPAKFLLSSSEGSQQLSRELSEQDLDLFKTILSETLEILESQEVSGLTRRLCRQGFAHLSDNLTPHFADGAENLENHGDENPPSPAQFVSPCAVRLPMAKVVPILASLVVLDEEEEEEWLIHIRDNSDLRLLAANVYESFCERREGEEEGGDNGSWITYISTSISSFF